MIDIEKAISKVLEKKKQLYPSHVNRISGLDDPCNRRLYYKRVEWNKAKKIGDNFAGILESGNKLEPVIQNIVSEVGMQSDPPFRIVGTQNPTVDDLLSRHKIHGSIDGFLQLFNEQIQHWETLGVIDIKTSTPNVFHQLSDYASLSKYSWTRRYRGQLMLYALANNCERCFILFVNKANLYQMKLIEFALDMQYAENLLQKAEQINIAVDSKTPPEKLNDVDTCPSCEFAHICCPTYSTGDDVSVISNDELLAILDELDELNRTKKYIDTLEKSRDVMLNKGQDIICGKWLVTWKKIDVKKKAQPASEYTQFRKKIVKGV